MGEGGSGHLAATDDEGGGNSRDEEDDDDEASQPRRAMHIKRRKRRSDLGNRPVLTQDSSASMIRRTGAGVGPGMRKPCFRIRSSAASVNQPRVPDSQSSFADDETNN